MKKIDHNQKGMGIVTALFVITVMAFIVVSLTSIVSSNAETTEEEVNLIRAFYAAESGVQFGLNALFPPPASGLATSCPVTTNYLSPLSVEGLNACTIELACSANTKSVAGKDYFTLTSTGNCGDVSRTIQVRAQ